MKSTTKLLISVYTLICYTSFAQSPIFTTNLNISNSFVCFDGQLTVSAAASNADFYQFQKRNETTNLWENIIGASGIPNLTTGSLSHTFFGINEAITTRVYLSKNSEIVYSNDLTITPQRPTFNFQPIDITECNGQNAIFRVSASGVNAITYQWQENIGGVFQNTTNTTDFSGMTSTNLTVKNLANNENGRVFRCLVKDQNNCENYSSSATLFVNQLSSTISPTLSTTFCEGDTAQFFVALKVGAVSSYEWQLKKTLDAVYSDLTESNHFEGVNTEKLSVNGIAPSETSYRLNVNFVSLGQNVDGTRASNTCLKTATRANYVIRPRPSSPTQIPDIYRCGEGKLTTTAAGTGSFYWYGDTTKAPLISNSANFASPIISESKPYFYSLKDINQCESYKRTFTAVVRPLPIQEYTKAYSICPSESFFTINFNSKNNDPLQLNVINHTPALPNFTPVLNETFSDSFNVPILNNSPSGNYKFKVFSKNEHCYSDTSIIDLEIKKATSINVSPSNSTICEGQNISFNIEYTAEAPVYFRWFKDDIIIPNETIATLTIDNITLQNQGNYTMEVSGQCGTKTSEKALLTVLPKINITEQPKETIVCENGNTKIKLVATGTGVLSYEWTLNGAVVGTNSSELILENVPISYNNAKIKCKISSDCGIPTYSNEILLLVDDLPLAPTIPSSIGFCKSNTLGVLSAVPTPKHSLQWFDESQNPFASNLIDIGSIYTKTYYVSQKDSNLCEGPKSSFEVKVSEPFSLNLISDKTGVCSSGLFNRTGSLNTSVYSTNSDLSSFSFDLQKNGLPISSNSTGEFEISEGGLYKVIGTSNYCSDTSEIDIISIHSELAVPPTVLPTFEVCKNSNLTIEATGSYSGGNFHWYSNATTQFTDFLGSNRTLTNIISAQSQYVAYGITSNDIYCESPRVLSSITLKPDLIIDAVVQNTSCLGINDGKIESSINNGQPPYTFTLNNITNSTGIFENLSIGNYQITASDSMGCKGQKDISIGLTIGPTITQQPTSISRCKSNIANFTIIANNYDQIIWEKKLPNTTSFEVIIGENQANLRVENIGNTANPHLTIYRAKIIKGACFIYSEEATLFVNAISGIGLPKSVCEGNTATIDLNDYNIVGSNKNYQWQYRLGTTGTFVDLNGKTSENLEILNTSISNEGYYRCKITFDNGGGNTCIINSSTSGIKLTVDTPQIPILSGEKTICKGQTTTLTATNCTGILTWSDGSTGLNVNISPNTTTTYTAICKIGTCNSPSEDSVKIIVEDGPINAPDIVLSRTKYCEGEKISITAVNCTGIVVWSNGLQGNSNEINAISSFNISAFCKTDNCQSPESPTIAITVNPVLTAGSIVSNSTINCSGHNPLTINSITNPNGGNIQWQKSEDCSAENPTWVNINGETGPTYNPPALLKSTCFRRMVSDSCQTLFSNITTFEIVPDPILEILADKNQVCFGQKATFTKNLIGGEGICGIQWQINKVSSAVSSSFWRNITVADVMEFNNNNTGNDSTFHFRARVDCSNNSCNLATSNVVSVTFHPELLINTTFSDSTICSGSSITLSSSGCKANILWSTGETSEQISVSPIINTTYSVSCKNSCDEVSKSFNINVVPGISAPLITVSKTKYCTGENIQISASNCDGEVFWSNGLSGNLINISASNSFTISAHCNSDNCQSQESQTIAITVNPVLTAGSIVSNSTINCSGFNPLTINNITNPNGGNIQWQKSEDCSAENPTWVNILEETGLTYNPPALLKSTCFRRMASDSCQTLFSNVTTFEIVSDPTLEVLADKNQVCFGEKVIFTKNLVGGEGICGIQWQINKVSSAVSSSFWRNITIADVMEFDNNNSGNDSTFHFRARVDCSNNSCNLATSNVVSVVFHPDLVINTAFSDSTICSGSSITLSSSGCKANILWSTGETSEQISVSPIINTTYSVSCKNSCDEVSKSFNTNVVPGISAPLITVSKTKYCTGENIQISASNCDGEVFWSNGLSGNLINISASNSFTISAHCNSDNCQSQESQTIAITVNPVLTAGSIVSNSTINCSGFNPLTINNITNPNGGNIQWQKSEDCSAENPTWVNILEETGLTYNPPALLKSTCFRRMASDSCQTLFSNVTTFEIVSDPTLEVLADKNQVCFGEKVIFTKNLVGGEGICGIQWQINKVSSAVSSSFWRNITIADVMEFDNNNSGNDSTFHFRARVDCSNNSCNLATSNVVSVVFHPDLVINTAFSDSTICSGSSITLSSSGCKANILWSTGETSEQISVSPIINTTYSVSCKNSCDEVSKSFNTNVVPGISAPLITVSKTKYCTGENIQISASNCDGEVFWSNGLSGNLITISASNSFNISAHCISQNCQSPESPTIAITVNPVLTAGSIVSNSTINCSGFNPLTINSITNPNGGNIQWQKSEDCSAENPTWVNINGENGLTYNPPALLKSTCFRRMVSDSCQTLFSNITTFEIVPDPILEILVDKDQVCFGQKVTFSKNLIGGEGICGIQWQINKVSSTVSSSFWTNITVADVLEFSNNNLGNDSTFHFRARVDCSNNSCNLATSNVVSVVFHPELLINTAFSDSTICSGSSITLSSSGCKANILWSTGETSAQISVSPNVNSTYSVSCKNSCDEVSKNFNISLVEGIVSPNITVSKTKYCTGENIQISASNCDGEVFWSNGLSGNLINISASNSFTISAHCNSDNCQSQESQTIAITVNPVLTAGSIVSNSTINCSGFNPLTINNITNPNGGNIQWQKSEDCSAENPTWVNILEETGLTYNPPALLKSTCFRRMVSDSCQTLFSNITTFEIVPDPILEIQVDKNQVCFGQKVTFSKNLIGGEGICGIQWQINKVSSAVSSSFWTNITVADVLEFSNNNLGNDSTFHFRARVDCSNNSCNLATSNVVSVTFHPELLINTTFSDSTICSGSSITLSSSGCKANILWSTGETSEQISVSPIINTTYSVSCKNSCDEVSKSFNINVVPGISAPLITVSKTKYCTGENIQISASNCDGEVVWNNGLFGNSINISASNSFNISAHCNSDNCQSPESPTIAITVYPVLTAGSIVSNSSINCSGFNPLTINSITNTNGGNIQWQKSENCSVENPVWIDINGENGLTYNPPALLKSTCFRRMVSDSCQTLFSNITTFEIVPDPILEILADKNQVCFGQKVIFTKNLIGGEGICGIQWQINKVSSAVSSSFWTNITVADVLEFSNNNLGNDSTFHFRARVDCSNNSCNLATSNVISAVFHPELVINTAFSDSTICSGSSITLSNSGCKANILWSTGETSEQISVSPIINTTYSVACKNTCDEVSKNFNIRVVEGIEKPVNTTPESFLSPQILNFTADGQNLKWYNSLNSIVPLTQAPEITIPGNYTYWVTQTIGICESPKLEIQSKLFPALKIISQPSNITNCFGNTSNIVINASGSGILKYKWQRKRPNETSFTDITSNQSSLENFDSKELKIKSIGNPESPYLSKFRCIINDDFSEKQSEEIEIVVNRLEGNLANQKLCLGNNLDLNLNNSHKITGSPTLIQWQQRQGTGTDWVNLKDSANYSGTNTLHFSINNLTLENQKQYRCSVLFNSTTGTCTETTDLMSLSVGSFPQNPENKGFEFCQNVNSPKLELYEPNNLDITWYLPGSQIGMTKQPIIDTKIAGNQIYYYSFTNSGDCESPKATVQIIINPEPPKPINITPNQVIEGQSLVFSAFGENLKWYTSRTGKTFTSTSPTYQKIGSYDHYVSQTSPKGCESDRTYIESEIITAFGITTQPISQANCEDNTTTFTVKTKGSTSVNFRWQILKNGTFEDILGENTSSLKIEDVGKAPYLDGTIYRCVVSNATQEIFSNEVTLKVNKIEGKLADMEICENNFINTSIYKENIVGNFSQIEWQKREGDSYITKFISKKIEDNFLATSDNSGTYRLRVTFQNQGSSTCVRTSNSLKIAVNKKPEPLQKLNYSVCQYASMKTIMKEFPSNYVLKNLDSSLANIDYFNESKAFVFIGNYSNEKGCTGDYQKINFDILPAPKLEMGDSTLSYCQFSNELKSLKINELNTLWYLSETDEEATENAFQINTFENQTHFRWYALEGNNGCLSQKNKINIDLNPCFYTEKKDTCLNQSGKTLMPNEWNYFYDINGKIYAAIHPNGQNLGTVRIDFRNTKDSLLLDINETHLYPRYFNVQTSRKSTSEFKLRFYMTLQEITAITGKDPKDVSVINYAGQNLDCDLLNNKIEDNYWLETNETWLEENQQNIYFVEFSTQKIGEFGLWDTSIPKGLLSGVVNSSNIPELTLSDKTSGGNYIIMKSKDGKTWFEWLPNITQSEFVDLKPFVLDNYYQLLLDFGNGIKTFRNTVKLTLADENVECAILENPSENRDFIKLYFPNIDKTTIRLSTVLGQSLDLEKTSEVSDYLEIYPKSQLSAGLYILSAQNSFGKNCLFKVWLK